MVHLGFPHPISGIGWVGVDIFFVLSGFLITGILADTADEAHRGRRFYTRRALRIFPLYYGVLLLVFVVLPLVRHVTWDEIRALDPERLWYFLYLSAWRLPFGHPPGPTMLGHLWTLSIEEQFYWLWPLVIWNQSRAAARRWCTLLLVAASLLRVLLVLYHPLLVDAQYPAAFAYFLPPTRMDGLLVGAWLALTLREPAGEAAASSVVWPATALSALVLGVVCAVRQTVGHDDPWMIMLGYPSIAFLGGGLVLHAVRGGLPILEWAPLRWLGKYSYGIYVLHLPIIRIGGHYLPISGGRFALLVIPIILAAAYVSYNGFERYFVRLKDRLAPREAPSALRQHVDA